MYGFFEVEIHRAASVVDSVAGIASLFGRAGCDISWNQVAEGRITTLEVVVALILRDIGGFEFAFAEQTGFLGVLRHPDTAVVTQRLAHQRELRLVVAVHRDACRVNLREARIRHAGAFLIALPDGRSVRRHRVCREVKHASVAS